MGVTSYIGFINYLSRLVATHTKFEPEAEGGCLRKGGNIGKSIDFYKYVELFDITFVASIYLAYVILYRDYLWHSILRK